jgi:hypothetical protein
MIGTRVYLDTTVPSAYLDDRAPDRQRLTQWAFDEYAYNLAQEYVRRGIFPEKYGSDANHVATAVVNGISYFASWNFRHLVKIQTRREVNLVNALTGYGAIEIVAPQEL